jgi:hypothetical protein
MRARLRELYGFDFPDELFEVAAWHRALTGEAARAFGEVLGISLRGPFDALAGKLDGPLRYPAVLHWRYQYDLPELFTVMVGDTDGLHWGYWFDDPGRLPPVVASFYARDGVELTQHASLLHAIAAHGAAARRGVRENRRTDAKHASRYDRDLAALDALDAVLPAPRPQPAREPVADTPDGMGIVVDTALLGTWNPPIGKLDRAAALAFADAELAAGRPGSALEVGRALWDGAKLAALDLLARAYAALDRAPLRAAALAHRAHPAIPSLDVTTYKPGDYTDLADALAHPDDVVELSMPARRLGAARGAGRLREARGGVAVQQPARRAAGGAVRASRAARPRAGQEPADDDRRHRALPRARGAVGQRQPDRAAAGRHRRAATAAQAGRRRHAARRRGTRAPPRGAARLRDRRGASGRRRGPQAVLDEGALRGRRRARASDVRCRRGPEAARGQPDRGRVRRRREAARARTWLNQTSDGSQRKPGIPSETRAPGRGVGFGLGVGFGFGFGFGFGLGVGFGSGSGPTPPAGT